MIIYIQGCFISAWSAVPEHPLFSVGANDSMWIASFTAPGKIGVIQGCKTFPTAAILIITGDALQSKMMHSSGIKQNTLLTPDKTFS